MDQAIIQNKIAAEYLLGETTYRKLGAKYGCSTAKIHKWVVSYKKYKEKNQGSEAEELPSDVKQLQEELRMARLHIQLLEATIDIADEQLGTNIRKKPGTRQS
jgi:transposase-like protein